VGNLSQIIIQTPDHDYGEALSRFNALSRARRIPALCRSAIATVCGTVKLTVAVTVIPSATQSSSTSRPALVAGSLTAIFGAQAWKRLAIAAIRSRFPRAKD